MQRVTISIEETVERLMASLDDQFPGTLFALRRTDDDGSRRDLRGVDLVWIEGPQREEVEEAIDRFQGITWDPRSGNFESRCHFQVGDDGQLVEVLYDLDYIFCDGPTRSLRR